ncbi:30S ribosomal protein S15 [Candidatus Woesearchaeota archaeon CG11_big_fil_rev_8_21_14_0_20_43_8]|nr:MAG: 30S ribosomal protein S15 [Candidatus Woesearchaeota archaeon CG11_big_fil_rev_8_21_14_0_20_43_8]
MARMHSRKRGKSGSKRPSVKTLPSWVRYKPKEVEILVAKLGKEGATASEIGLHMRDIYGIPDVKLITKKKIGVILKAKKLEKELPDDLLALIRKSVMIRKHREENRQDQTAKRGLKLTESKINRLVKYYKRSGRLAPSWKYRPENSRFYLE